MEKTNKFTIDLICPACSNSFARKLSEHKRNTRKGTPQYCSIRCQVATRNKQVTNSTAHLLKGFNKSDALTPFRYTYRNCSRRDQDFSIALEDLKELWDKQKGICPYSGVALILPKGTGHKVHLTVRASLDRIDSSKGYVTNNVQFVSTAINLMKQSMSHQETLDFCIQLAKNYSSYLED